MVPVTLSVNGSDLAVDDLRGTMALSALFHLTLRTRMEAEPAAVADLVGQPATVTIEDPFAHTMELSGVVMSVERSMGAASAGSLLLTVEPLVAPLGVGRNCRVFQEMSVPDIVKKVLDEEGIDAATIRWAASGSYPKRAYTAQYRESSWAFIERLVAEEGIYYFFELAEGATKLVFADDSTASAELEGGAEMPVDDVSSLGATRDCMIRVTRKATIKSSAVRLRDYNFDKPRLSLDAEAGDPPHERYDFPGRFDAPAEGDRLARVRLEALRARRSVTRGETASARVRPGLITEITEHPLPSINGRYLIERVSLRWTGVENRSTVSWEAIPADVPYRCLFDKPFTASPGGPQTGVVVGASGEEIHPDKSGRVRVQHYWDREGQRDDKASTWMRVGQFPLGGSMILPRIGWDMLVGHHEGDIDRPAVVTHLYDGEHPVPYALPANKTRTAFQTATTPGGGSTNEVRFEDKAGSEEIFLNASKDMNVVVGDCMGETIGVNHEHTIGSNLDTKIGSDLKLGVISNQSVSIGGSESLTISGKRAVSIQGSDSVSIGGSRSVTVSGGSTLEATGGRTLTVGGSLLAAAALGVNRAVLGTLSVSIGGAWINAAGAGVGDVVGGAGALTVGGAKIDLGATGCKTAVKGALAETVGGAYVITAGKNVGESAGGSLSITVGGAFLGNAPTIEIEGESKISILCGGASLTITSSSVEIKAPAIAAPGATIKKKASKIEHN